MRVKVLYFAGLRALAGVREEMVELPEAATVEQVREVLARRRPELEAALESAVTAVNREFASPGDAVREGDEIAFFPPVSGGSTRVDLTEAPLDVDEVVRALAGPATGAVCVFAGLVRARTERNGAQETHYLEYEAFVPMAREKLAQVAQEMRERWPALEGIVILQRIGRLEPGTPSVVVATSAAHRDSGVFEAARYGIDRLKEIVPIWKKEVGPGGEHWVEGSYRPGVSDRRG